MCLTPACPRSPLLLSRHGTRCIPHRWRHAGWLSIGHKSPCGRWHRYPRLESADASHAWLDPAEQWQVGRQSAKTRKTNRVRPNMRAQKRFTGRLLSTVTKYADPQWLQSVIHITSHRTMTCGCFSRPLPITKNGCPRSGAPTDRSTSAGWILASLGWDRTNTHSPQTCHPERSAFQRSRGTCFSGCPPRNEPRSIPPTPCHPTHSGVIPSEALFSGVEGPAFRDASLTTPPRRFIPPTPCHPERSAFQQGYHRHRTPQRITDH